MLSTQINFTSTYYADHSRFFSHDSINRFLKNSKITSALILEHVEGDITPSPRDCIVFDDSVLDKNHSHSIEMVRRQYSGNAHSVIKGIGMINCLYVNPDNGQYWIVDSRLYDPDGDGKTKPDHVKDMLLSLIANKGLAFNRVLMDSWYATKELILFIEQLGKIYYCPLNNNRLVDDSGGALKYRHIDSPAWTQAELAHGKVIKIRGFPKEHKVKLFRVEVSNNRTDWVVTNDLAQNSLNATQDACGIRWKLSNFTENSNS